MDISRIIAPISLKTCVYIPDNYVEGRVSQNYDEGLIFVLLYVVCIYRWQIKRDIFIQKIKVKILVIN